MKPLKMILLVLCHVECSVVNEVLDHRIEADKYVEADVAEDVLQDTAASEVTEAPTLNTTLGTLLFYVNLIQLFEIRM